MLIKLNKISKLYNLINFHNSSSTNYHSVFPMVFVLYILYLYIHTYIYYNNIIKCSCYNTFQYNAVFVMIVRFYCKFPNKENVYLNGGTVIKSSKTILRRRHCRSKCAISISEHVSFRGNFTIFVCMYVFFQIHCCKCVSR